MMNLTPLLLLLLVGSLQLVSGSPGGENSGRGSCCQTTTRVKISPHRITSYYRTSSNCPIKAVIFRMNTGKLICVDPEAPWIKNHIKVVDLKQKSSTTSRTIKPITTSTPSTTLTPITNSKPIRQNPDLSTSKSNPKSERKGSYGANAGRGPCCEKTTTVKISPHRITSYYWTSSNCPIKAVIFKMKTGKQICVNPEAPWIKNHMKVLDLKLKSSTTS